MVSSTIVAIISTTIAIYLFLLAPHHFFAPSPSLSLSVHLRIEYNNGEKCERERERDARSRDTTHAYPIILINLNIFGPANVVTFFASYRSLDMSMWIVMEYCGGGAVADLLKYRALDEDEAAYVLRETLRGLHHLHEQCKKHIIHRDLKSANLLLTTAGDVKVADFGVSKILDIAIAGRKTRSFVGTPHWMAPEVIMGKPYDARCDIWSVGIVGIEMAEQHPPKFNVNMHGVLAAIPKLPAPTLCSPQDHSTLFCNFLNHVLVKEPHQRPTAIEALAHCLVGGSSDGHGKRKDAADSGEESAALTAAQT